MLKEIFGVSILYFPPPIKPYFSNNEKHLFASKK